MFLLGPLTVTSCLTPDADPFMAPLSLRSKAPVTSPLDYFLPHCSVSSSHTCLFSVSPTHQAQTYLRTFAHAVPSAWNTLPQDMAHAFSSLLLKHHLLRDSPPNHSAPSPYTHIHSPSASSLL